MTLSIFRNRNYLADCATNTGWQQLTDYLRTLNADRFPNTAHLVEYGWSPFWVETREELRLILQNHKPRKRTVAKTLADLVRNLDGVIDPEDEDLLIISDGFGD